MSIHPESFQRACCPLSSASSRVSRQNLVINALRPGGHVFIATNAFVSQLVFGALVESGLEFRGEIIRLVRTLRGGDRPKNAEAEFSGVCSMAKGCYEPWGILRKPLHPGMRVSDCLREFQTGGLRRNLNEKPFDDVILSERTPRLERDIANHPSLKPQSLMRRLVYAALPLGEGVVVDPFMGAGSTIAAAHAVGVSAVGVERDDGFYELARNAVPRLARLHTPNIEHLVGSHAEESLFHASTASGSPAR
jgi:site-specific DNA-methyltransferase (adenine-specific)